MKLLLILIICSWLNSSHAMAKPNLSEEDIVRARVEMKMMVAEDQAIRNEIMRLQKKYGNSYILGHSSLYKYWVNIDKHNTQEIKKIILHWGWPDPSLFGRDYGHDIFLIAQHANDIKLQKTVLNNINKLALQDKELLKKSAYLQDRICIKQKLPQRYGTQGFCLKPKVWQPYELENSANINNLRKSVGLNSFYEYKKMMNQVCY